MSWIWTGCCSLTQRCAQHTLHIYCWLPSGWFYSDVRLGSTGDDGTEGSGGVCVRRGTPCSSGAVVRGAGEAWKRHRVSPLTPSSPRTLALAKSAPSEDGLLSPAQCDEYAGVRVQYSCIEPCGQKSRHASSPWASVGLTHHQPLAAPKRAPPCAGALMLCRTHQQKHHRDHTPV